MLVAAQPAMEYFALYDGELRALALRLGSFYRSFATKLNLLDFLQLLLNFACLITEKSRDVTLLHQLIAFMILMCFRYELV